MRALPHKIPISTDGAPPSEGTHTQAIRSGNLVFLTGQTGRHPETGELARDLGGQTRRMLANVESILIAAGCSKADIVKVTLMMADIKLFFDADVIYRQWLPPREEAPYPARAAFAAATLPDGALVEIDVIAAVPEA